MVEFPSSLIETRKLFLPLYDKVVELFYEWKIFRQLFASGEENLKLLNESGSNVFALLRNLIMNNVFLGLCCLTDPPEMRGHKNLSLKWFLKELGSYVNGDWRLAVETKLDQLDEVMKNIDIHRNKRIGHFDLNCAIEAGPLPPVLYGDVEEALDLV
jgi:HEPN superfamily AbiU2-like protein